MASTKTIQNSIDATRPYLRYKPVKVGSNGEPAMTIANTLLQLILGPPFIWEWNRKTVSFTTAAGSPPTPQQDITVNIPTWGFIEKAAVFDGNTQKEIEVRQVLGSGAGDTGRPDFIAAQVDDGAGNITFRTLPFPDQTYNITVTYQAAAPLLNNFNTTWTPIPDRFGYLYNDGMLALLLFYVDDPRALAVGSRFINRLLATQGGMSEEQKDIFRNDWTNLTSQITNKSLSTQQGVQARSGM